MLTEVKNRLKEMLVRHESYKIKPYRCPSGCRTIGVGHNYDANPLPRDMSLYLQRNGHITPDMIGQLLDDDINNAIEDCLKLYPDFNAFTPNRQVALADFLFNVGIVTARKFQATNRAVNEGRWNDVATGLSNSKWAAQVGKRSADIIDMVKRG
jgi:lysozyme